MAKAEYEREVMLHYRLTVNASRYTTKENKANDLGPHRRKPRISGPPLKFQACPALMRSIMRGHMQHEPRPPEIRKGGERFSLSLSGNA